jgi:hypothetical protein
MRWSGLGRPLLSTGLGVALLCSAPAAARADDAAKASALAEAALARVKQGERRVAIDLFDEAYAVSPQREYLREIGKLYDGFAYAGDARDVRLAILYYERFLAGEGPTAERAAVEASLTRLRTWKARMRAEPQTPAQTTVPLHLLSYAVDTSYEVSIGSETCATPCTLVVLPGPAYLKATGPGTVEMQFVVPPRPGQIRLQHGDTNGFYAGAAMVPLGVLIGGGMWALAFLCPASFDGGSACEVANLATWPLLGASTLITGIVLLARGRREPPADANRVERIGRGGAPLRLTSFGLAPLVGSSGGSAAMGFSF